MKKFSSTTRANARRISQNKTLRTIVIVGAVMLLLFYGVPYLFSGAVALVFTPINATKTWFTQSTASLPQYLRNRSALLEQVNDLQEQRAEQSGSEHTVNLLSKENEQLRSLLSDTQQEKILAGVIGRPNQLPYDVLVLDKGYADGIVEGAPVFIGGSVVGIIQKTFITSSVVVLITSPDFVTSVFIVGPDIYTNAVGLGGGQLRVGVPQGIEINEGDLVILPAVSSGVYGTINAIESVASRPEQYGYVSPEIALSSIRLVGVGRTPLAPISFEEAQEIVKDEKAALLQVPVPEDILIVADQGTTTPSNTATSSEDAL